MAVRQQATNDRFARGPGAEAGGNVDVAERPSIHEFRIPGFCQFAGDLKLEKILHSLNVGEVENAGQYVTHETEEYGGYLLMLDAVPNKAEYDYGSNYLRIFSTFIARMTT